MNEETLRAERAAATPAKSGSEPLAQWLLRLMREPHIPTSSDPSSPGEGELHGNLCEEDHLQFFGQLPDFVTALLLQDEGATLRYAPLLYHLVGCDDCHQAYLEIYDALRAALTSQDGATA
jgi:hypothetical protein